MKLDKREKKGQSIKTRNTYDDGCHPLKDR